MFNFVYFIFVYVFVLLYFFGKVLVIWGGSEKWTRTIENLMSRIYPFFSWSKYPHFGLKDLRWDRFVSESTTLGWVMRLNRTVGVTKLVVEWRRPWTHLLKLYFLLKENIYLFRPIKLIIMSLSGIFKCFSEEMKVWNSLQSVMKTHCSNVVMQDKGWTY